MSLEDVVIVDMYVNPTTKKVEKVIMFTPFGMTQRVNSDWEATTIETSGILDLAEDKVYRLDWDTDFIPMDSEEDDREHAAIDLYDQGVLTETQCQKYCKLRIDPSNKNGSPEMAALVEKLNREGK
jgi:hypothetical protein